MRAIAALLAFAVAAHLEPEILVVDEVLAVGDAGFQKKCLGKMEDVARQGRTILFVSHSLSSVAGVCKRAMLLKEGRMISIGEVGQVMDDYVPKIVSGTATVEKLTMRPHCFFCINRAASRQNKNVPVTLVLKTRSTVDNGVSIE